MKLRKQQQLLPGGELAVDLHRGNTRNQQTSLFMFRHNCNM